MEEYELDLFYMFREMQIQQFLQKEIVIVLVIEKLIKVYLQYMYFYYFLYFYIYGESYFLINSDIIKIDDWYYIKQSY